MRCGNAEVRAWVEATVKALAVLGRLRLRRVRFAVVEEQPRKLRAVPDADIERHPPRLYYFFGEVGLVEWLDFTSMWDALMYAKANKHVRFGTSPKWQE